jgi:hypothetical protein
VESAGVPTEVDTYSWSRHVVLPCRSCTVLRVRRVQPDQNPLPPRRQLHPAKRISFSARQDRPTSEPSVTWARGVGTDGSGQPVEHRARAPGPPDPPRGAASSGRTGTVLLAAGRHHGAGPGGSSAKPRPRPGGYKNKKILSGKNIFNHAAVAVQFGKESKGSDRDW